MPADCGQTYAIDSQNTADFLLQAQIGNRCSWIFFAGDGGGFSVSRQMTYSVIKGFYDRPPDKTTESTLNKLKAIQLLFEPNRGGYLLDVGCHDGEKTVVLKQLLAANLAVGIDFECAALSDARKRGIACVVIDLNQKASLPFPDASFDCIHAGEVIEHIYSPDLLLSEICRLLKPSGYAVITTPNLASWRNRIVMLLGWQPFGTEVSTFFVVGNPRASKGSLPGHIRVFTVKAIKELVTLYGLRVDRLIGCPNGIPNSFVTRLTAIVDLIVEKCFPTMSDSILIRVSKKDVASDGGGSGQS